MACVEHVVFILDPEFLLEEGRYQESYLTPSGILFETRIIGVIVDVLDLERGLKVFGRLIVFAAMNRE